MQCLLEEQKNNVYKYIFEIQMSGWFLFNSFQIGFPLRECHKFDWKKKWVFFFWVKTWFPLMENVILCIQKQMPWDIFLRKNMIENYFLNQVFLLWHWFCRFHFLKLLFISLFKLMVWILNLYMFFLFKMTVLIFLMIVTTTRFDYIEITARIIVQR